MYIYLMPLKLVQRCPCVCEGYTDCSADVLAAATGCHTLSKDMPVALVIRADGRFADIR